MEIERLRWAVLGVVLTGAGLLAWTFSAARGQCRFVEDMLIRQAAILSQSLGPSLVAASDAAKLTEEMIHWKLLDNARLFAELADADFSPERLLELVRLDGLDSLSLFSSDGTRRLAVGDEIDVAFLLSAVLAEEGEARILGPLVHDGIAHVAAVARSETGDVALVSVHATTARDLVEAAGVTALLRELVGTGGLLYLELAEIDPDRRVSVTWDGGPIPEAPGPRTLFDLRDRKIFEVDLPVLGLEGSAQLRVGLDGEPLVISAAAARRRNLLFRLTIAGFVLAGLGAVFLLHLRSVEAERSRAAREHGEEERRRSERLTAAGALTAGLAHEVRSPLNAIGLAAQRLERRLADDDENRQIAAQLGSEIRRLEGVLRSFLELASPVSETRRPEDLRGVVATALRLLRDEAEASGNRLVFADGPRVPVRIDRDAIHRAILNLVHNALQASRPGDEVEVRVDEEEGHAVLRVLDRGPGLSPELGERVFDPFVSSRPEGTGLGLPLVRRVAEEHGGAIALVPRPDGGLVARLSLPLDDGAA